MCDRRVSGSGRRISNIDCFDSDRGCDFGVDHDAAEEFYRPNAVFRGICTAAGSGSEMGKLHGGGAGKCKILFFRSCFLKRTWVYRRDFLKKSIFAVCDLDSSYACNLMDYLNEKRSTPFEVQAFTNVESLKEFASEQEIEILLISTRAMCNEIRELPISRVVILSEGEQFQETDLEYPFVYKYQSSDQLISEVIGVLCRDESEYLPAYNDGKDEADRCVLSGRAKRKDFICAGSGRNSCRNEAGAVSEPGGVFRF